MKKILLLLVVSLVIQLSHSQIYTPIDTLSLEQKKTLSKDYLSFTKKFISNFEKVYSDNGKGYIRKHFEKHFKDFNADLLDGDYIVDNRFSNIVDSITQILQKGNNGIPNDLKFYIAKDITLNAFSMGDKTFGINIGTFYFLENDNQLAAILCHEIGHLLLWHEFKVLQYRFKAEKIDSKTEMANVKSKKENRGSRALESYRNILYYDNKLSRIQEIEADSLGYILYKNAGFNKNDYLSAFKLLSKYDSIRPIGLIESTYKSIFDIPNQPFKAAWFKSEDFSAYDYSKYKSRFNEDSLKTHPETIDRIDHLKKIFSELTADTAINSIASGSFLKAQHIAYMELIPVLNFNEDYGSGIYMCLLQLQDDKTNIYFKNWLGKLFLKVYDARKSYTLNRYLDRVNPKDQSESYQKFLNFMWNLNLNELKNIATYYSSVTETKN